MEETMDSPVPTYASPYRTRLIVAGALIVGGYIANTVVGLFHPSRENPNNHLAVFAEYASSTDWIWVHYAQFAGALTMLAGFVVLHSALTVVRAASALDLVAFGAAITTAATVTVLQAVDGVALKHAVNAWAVATGPDKAARFADAEVVRWIEWGVNSYFYTMFGVTLVLFGAALLRSILPKWLGMAALVAGLAFVAAALPVGYRGFQTSPAAMVAVVALGATAIGIIISGVRAQHVTRPDDAPPPTVQRTLLNMR
jgi:hypothetical protein